MNERNISPILK
jgi:hypothetical protein